MAGHEQDASAQQARFLAFAASAAPDVVLDDRRRGLRYSTTGRDGLLENVQALELPIVSVKRVAGRGERLVLYRVLRKGAGPHGGGDAEVELLILHEMNERGELAVAIAFDPDDLEAATAELDARAGEDR